MVGTKSESETKSVSGKVGRRGWSSAFLIALALFATANVALWLAGTAKPRPLTRQQFADPSAFSTGKPGCWWMAKAYLEQDRAPDVVVFGSSQMGGVQAADANTLRRTIDFALDHQAITIEQDLDRKLGTHVRAVWCAQPGAMASDHYMISRALFAPPLKPRLVIVGLSPRDFIDNTLPSPGATEPYRFFSQFVDPGKLKEIAFDNLWDRLNWFLSRQIPLRIIAQANETDAGAANAGHKAAGTHQLLNVISTASGNIKPGQCIVAPDMPPIFVDNTAEYSKRYRNTSPPAYKQQLAFFNAFANSMDSSGIKLLAVGMPLLPANRNLLPENFWLAFRSEIGGICLRNRAVWVDFSDSQKFDRSDFVDTVHLNARGGSKLAELISQCVAQNGDLSAALTSNSSSTPQASRFDSGETISKNTVLVPGGDKHGI